MGDILTPEVKATHKDTIYDLLANIVHDGEPASGKGTYRVHVLHKVRATRHFLSLETSSLQSGFRKGKVTFSQEEKMIKGIER